MLVTFTTDTYADITMCGYVALAMLKMMGHSSNVPGQARNRTRSGFTQMVSVIEGACVSVH